MTKSRNQRRNAPRRKCSMSHPSLTRLLERSSISFALARDHYCLSLSNLATTKPVRRHQANTGGPSPISATTSASPASNAKPQTASPLLPPTAPVHPRAGPAASVRPTATCPRPPTAEALEPALNPPPHLSIIMSPPRFLRRVHGSEEESAMVTMIIIIRASQATAM